MNLSPAVAEELSLDGVSEGVVVAAVEDGSNAQQVGFQKGDVVLSINNEKPATSRDVERLTNDRGFRWQLQISRGGLSLDVQVSLAIDVDAGAAADAASDNHVTAPLPGVVTGLFVEAGALVSKGDSLVQMEAMKLVHTLAAPRDGRIARIHCAVGDVVASGAPLIDITADGED